MRVYRTVTATDHENVSTNRQERKKSIILSSCFLSMSKYRHCVIKHHYIKNLLFSNIILNIYNKILSII